VTLFVIHSFTRSIVLCATASECDRMLVCLCVGLVGWISITGFVHCLIFNWLLLALYIIITATYPGASALNSTEALKKKFVQTVIGVAIGNVIFCVHAYKHDFNKRKDFLGSKQLERAEVRVEKTLVYIYIHISIHTYIHDMIYFKYLFHDSIIICVFIHFVMC
jgi:hypothetical protein